MPPKEDVLTPLLLRSITPAPNEKVMAYLHTMAKDEPSTKPPQSVVDADERESALGSVMLSPNLRNLPTTGRSRQGSALAPPNQAMSNEQDDHSENDDLDSNIQVGRRSDDGGSIAPQQTSKHRPKYESYDSIQTWGNAGPMPDDYSLGNPWVKKNAPQPVYNNAILSPKAPLANDFGGSPRTSNKHPTIASETRNRTPPNRDSFDELMSPKSTSRGQRTANMDDKRPLSPLSAPSRATEKTRRSEQQLSYPPLPDSNGDGDTYLEQSTSPRAKSRSKVPSLAPSDSLSQIKHYRPQPNAAAGWDAEVTGQSTSPKVPSKVISQHTGRSQPANSYMTGSQTRPFSPYRLGPTHADLMHAAVRGRSLAVTEEEQSAVEVVPEKVPSIIQSQHIDQKSQASDGKVSSRASAKQPSTAGPKRSQPSQLESQLSHHSQSYQAPSQHSQSQNSQHSHHSQQSQRSRRSKASSLATASESEGTPRAASLLDLNEEEARIVNDAVAGHITPRTSYYAASTVDPVATNNFHDPELCVLLQQESSPTVPDVVKKVLRKAIKSRIKDLGMKYNSESIRQIRQAHQNHDPVSHLQPYMSDEPPKWAEDLKRELVLMQQRIESLGPKIENLRFQHLNQTNSVGDLSLQEQEQEQEFDEEIDDYPQSNFTQTVNIRAGTVVDSQYQPAETESLDEEEEVYDDLDEPHGDGMPTDGETQTQNRSNYAMSVNQDNSPGLQVLAEELYKLYPRQNNPNEPTQWDVMRDEKSERSHTNGQTAPTIPDETTTHGNYQVRERGASPPLPALPTLPNDAHELIQQSWPMSGSASGETLELTPWQKVHQRLLNWAIVWPMNELDRALNSTTRGHQIDEVALSIWSTQTYKRFVRALQSDNPPGVVDRMFVPPNMAETISNAVFNGRHSDACQILRDLWAGFGLGGMPRLVIVLAKHRNNDNHWVVHRYALPDGALTTYDSFPERTLHDGRPLGWWFAIRLAWPNGIYPSPDHLMQKMVRLHRPLQSPIDNSVAAAGIFRNVLLGSRAERSLDLERLRDLINTEVRNIRQRKAMGKMTISGPRSPWMDMH